MNLLIIVYILIIIIFALIAYSVMQIKLAGMNVKDFWDFVQANQTFDKVPNILWEDEYQKYSKILEIYKNIKVLRWNREVSQQT